MKQLDFQTYFLSLMESNYLAGLQQGLAMQKRIYKETLKTKQYDVEANAKLPKVNADLKVVSSLLKGHQNVINNYLQQTYDFKFESIKVDPIEEPVEKVEQMETVKE
jgi:hypothetical protein